MKHVFSEYMTGGVRPDPFHIFSSEEWSQQTSTMMRLFLVQNLPTPIEPQPVISGPISSSRPAAYSPAALELMSFKKGIKREITAYPSLKDERYFDGFKRSPFIVAKTHKCSEVLDPNYTPGSEHEEKELFEAKQTFIFSVFNTNLQTDMGKTIVRRHLASTDAQAMWKELSEHMKTSSKGASEKRRLTQYVTNTVLDDNFKGTTEQFVLHFNEQFRQLEEISEDDERLPPTVKLTLLQTAVRSINDLRIVETLDEFHVEKSVFSIWVDLFLCRSIQLLVLSYAEMFVYMYLSQLMSTFTNYHKGVSSSRWCLHSMTRRTSDPTITHIYLYTRVPQI